MKKVCFVFFAILFIDSVAFAGKILDQYKQEQRENDPLQYKGSAKTDYHSNKSSEKPNILHGAGMPGSATSGGSTPTDLNNNGSQYGKRRNLN